MTFKRYNYPESVRQTAKNRVKALLENYYLQTATLPLLLESAYLQGVVDATEIYIDEEICDEQTT